jgi:4,5:9,10-diseco-3-hydroxy-5,9,17-trioxoandrosta-1(10),2-diene-4-oate hydrolase
MSTLELKTIATAQVSERWITVDGVRVRYLQGGTGPPLVLVHGLIASAFSWRLNLPDLMRVRTVFALDLPGTGESERPPIDCSLKALAQWLLKFCTACGIDRFDLLGTSHGGALAMAAAALDAAGQRRVQKLLLVAAVNPWARGPRGRIAALNFIPAAITVPCMRALAPPLRGFFLRRVYGDPRRIPPGTAETYAGYLRPPGSVEHTLRILRTWHRDLDELERGLPQIAHLPTLLLWGERDPAVLATSALELAKRLPSSRTVLLPGVGHLPYEEAPTEFNAAVISFLGAS